MIFFNTDAQMDGQTHKLHTKQITPLPYPGTGRIFLYPTFTSSHSLHFVWIKWKNIAKLAWLNLTFLVPSPNPAGGGTQTPFGIKNIAKLTWLNLTKPYSDWYPFRLVSPNHIISHKFVSFLWCMTHSLKYQ